MKREKFPFTPLESKAKGKEIPDGNGSVFNALRPRGRARACARKAAMVKRWRDCVFADGVEDPVPAVVDVAVRTFGRTSDRRIWTWYANRIGVNTFLDRFFEVRSCWKVGEIDHPAAVFHMRLQEALKQIRGGGTIESARSCRGQGVPALAKKDRKARAGTPLPRMRGRRARAGTPLPQREGGAK